MDNSIYVYEIDQARSESYKNDHDEVYDTPIATFKGHEDPLSKIVWDPSGQMCLSYTTATINYSIRNLKVWTMHGDPKLAYNFTNENPLDTYCGIVCVEKFRRGLFLCVQAHLLELHNLYGVISTIFDQKQ